MAMYKRKDSKHFGKVIKERMIELEITQKELAELIKVHPQYISLIVNGKRSGLKYREKIRAVLGIPSIKNTVRDCYSKRTKE